MGGGEGTEAGGCGEGVELCGRISGVWWALSKGRGGGYVYCGIVVCRCRGVGEEEGEEGGRELHFKEIRSWSWGEEDASRLWRF